MYTSSYTPTYYTSLHDSIASLCKSILPFSLKKRRLPAIVAAEQRLSKQQSDNLKWQQDSFHQMLKLMGLCKEGILAESEVSAFRSHLLDTLIAAPPDYEQPTILRDKLVFLQELRFTKCISEEDYHSSKRPLLQRLAVQGAEIESRDVIVAAAPKEKSSEEHWSVIDLKDEPLSIGKSSSNSKPKTKNGSQAITQQIEAGGGGVSMSCKNEFSFSKENPFLDSRAREKESETRSILMAESFIPPESSEGEKGKKKKKMFRALFQKEVNERGDRNSEEKRLSKKSGGKKQWGFEGLKNWKKNDDLEEEEEMAALPMWERSDSEGFTGSLSEQLVASPVGEGPDTKQIKRKLHSNGSPSDFFVDKVLGEKIKKELLRIQTELNATNPSLQLSNDQIEAISTRLPVDRADLKNFFPKSWCDHYGDIVLDVVKKEFKNHVGEMESLRNAARAKHHNNNKGSKRWTTFDDNNDDDDEENCHPNLFAPSRDHHKCFKNNPFFPDYYDETNSQKESRTLIQNQNPFWTPPSHNGSSSMHYMKL